MGLTAHLAVAIEGVKRFRRDFPLHAPAQTAGLICHSYRSFLGHSVILPGKGCLQSRICFFDRNVRLWPRLCENYLLLNLVVDAYDLLVKTDFNAGNQK
jgi:hypothetical protein